LDGRFPHCQQKNTIELSKRKAEAPSPELAGSDGEMLHDSILGIGCCQRSLKDRETIPAQLFVRSVHLRIGQAF
jgi:hypothetical protein